MESPPQPSPDFPFVRFFLPFDTRSQTLKLHAPLENSLQPRPRFASIKAWMSDDVRQLLQKRSYSAAFEQLLDLYGKKVFRMAVMMLNDAGRAEEVTQDIFLKLWQALPAYDGRAAPSTWLYTIARNTCLSALRSESHRKTCPVDWAAEPAGSEAARDLLGRIELRQCVDRLP